MCSNAITDGIKEFSCILSGINILISPVLDTAHLMQNKIGMVKLIEVETSAIGCWDVFLYVSGRRYLLHTDNNRACIFITNPCQERFKIHFRKTKTVFTFKILEKTNNVTFE